MNDTEFVRYMEKIRPHLDIDIINKYSQLYDEQAIDRQIQLEKGNKEYHFPGTKFFGPGTKIATKIANNVQPSNRLDKAARQHDIDYLDGTMTREEADNKFNNKIPIWLRPAVALGMKVGKELNIGKKNKNDRNSTDAAVALRKIVS